MLATVASALFLVEKRRNMIQVFPNSFIKLVNDWEVRMFILLSLTLQILLFALGSRRKYIGRIWIRFTLWIAYLLADWVATVGLGTISKTTLKENCSGGTSIEDPLNQLMWFWAQFFLLHLGGPDTITAYSLEDNELWLRHLVGLVIQTGIAVYILVFALPGSSWLPILGILIFIAGVIKYGERMLALRAGSSENFRDSMLTEPDPGPNYAKFMEEFTLKKAEGFYVEAAEVIEIPASTHQSFPNDSGKLIPEAYDLFLRFKGLFADLILSFQDRDSSQSYFRDLLPGQAFDVVEVELSFVFDVLYTKAPVVYRARGFFLRGITFSLTCFALIAFCFLCDKREYKMFDLSVTYLLLGVALCLEIYAVVVLINSDWTDNWLSKHEGTHKSRVIKALRWPNKWRWSKQMAQHNLLDLCLKRDEYPILAVSLRIQPFVRSVRNLLKIDNHLEKHWYKTFVDVSSEMKDRIFSELHTYAENNDLGLTTLSNQRKSLELEHKYSHLSPRWTEEREFDQRILIWHIATDICYTLEWGDSHENVVNCNISLNTKRISNISKHISDYMLYLLVACPFMLPIGFGTIRFRDTCAEAKEFLAERNVETSKVRACKKLLEVNTEVPPEKVKGDRSKSVLFDACLLAKSLREEKEQKWEKISQVWVQMLAYAATHCRGNHHARQLRKGGELLTHIWLLMAHLGITEQFQINQGHARAKLIVK